MNSIWKSEDLVKQILEENVLSSERGSADRDPNIRNKLEQSRKDYSNIIAENEMKRVAGAINGGRKGASNARNITAISVVNQKDQRRPSGAEKRKSEAEIKRYEEELAEGADFEGEQQPDYPLGAAIADKYSNKDYRQSRKGIRKEPLDTGMHSEAKQRGARDQERALSRSFDRGNTSGARPRSASKDKSRDYGSYYSSVYSRILNAGEVNKIRKLVGEQNSDLDVVLCLTVERVPEEQQGSGLQPLEEELLLGNRRDSRSCELFHGTRPQIFRSVRAKRFVLEDQKSVLA